MTFLSHELSQWRVRPVRELMAGAVATFALIPEVIAFAFVAGIDPQVGLYASFVLCVVMAFTGGRPAMVTAAAGSVALVAAPLVAQHGLPYLLAAGVLAGILQVLFGLLRLGVLLRYVSQSVRTGFVNALAILIFSAQLPQLLGANGVTWAMLALGLLVIYGMPLLRLPALQLIPPPLICIVLLSALSIGLGLPLKTVGELGRLPDALPLFAWPDVPLSVQTLEIIALPALAIAMVGLLESLMTAAVVDELTDSPSNKNREASGLGLANVAASLFGGIAGCGMIGQSVGNVKYGGRGRLSTLFAGVLLLLLTVTLKPWMMQVPVVALVAVMVMVSVSTFDWRSLGALLRHPRVSSVVMVVTLAVTLATHNLAAGVLAGVLLSGVFFSFKMTRLLVVRSDDTAQSGCRVYWVHGPVFFASAEVFIDQFDPRDVPVPAVRLELADATFWDVTAVAALDKVVSRLRHHGLSVSLQGLGDSSRALVRRTGSPQLQRLCA